MCVFALAQLLTSARERILFARGIRDRRAKLPSKRRRKSCFCNDGIGFGDCNKKERPEHLNGFLVNRLLAPYDAPLSTAPGTSDAHRIRPTARRVQSALADSDKRNYVRSRSMDRKAQLSEDMDGKLRQCERGFEIFCVNYISSPFSENLLNPRFQPATA